MRVKLSDNNYTSNLIVCVKKGSIHFYCQAEVEYWIGEWWNGYIDLSHGSLEDLYFDFLQKFKVDYYDLCSEYHELTLMNDQYKLDGNLPVLFIDFGNKNFISNFYEQSLENRVAHGWIGKFTDVKNIIPSCLKYWMQEGFVLEAIKIELPQY
jgi:hypothetical protein